MSKTPLKSCILVSCLLIFFLLHLMGQSDQSRTHFTTLNGLPQLQVLDLHQDTRGYIWIATKGGLARYNGYNFKTYEYKDGLLGNQINRIVESSFGSMFIRTNKEIAEINGDSVKTILKLENPRRVRLLATDKEVYGLIPGEDGFNVISKKDSFFVSVPKIRGIGHCEYEKETQTVWITIATGTSDRKIWKFKIESGNWQLLELIANRSLIRNSSNTILANQIIPKNKNIDSSIVFDKNGSKLFSYLYNKVTLEASNYIIHNDTPNLWSQGLRWAYLIEKSIQPYQYFDNVNILDALQDKDGNIWIGGDNGVVLYKKSPFKSFMSNYFSDVWGVGRMPDGSLYVGSYSSGFYFVNKQNEIVQKELAPWNPYCGMSKDNNFNSYFPISRDGLLKVKADYSSEIINFGSSSLISFYDKVNNKVLAGAKGCFAIYNIEKDEVQKKCLDKNTSHIVSITADQDSSYWLGTRRSLSRYFYNSDSTHTFFSTQEEHRIGGAVALLTDSHGTVWIGGVRGLWKYQSEQDELVRIDESRIENSITALLSLGDSILVIGTLKELFVMNLKEYYDSGKLVLKVYNRHNGFLGQEVTQNALFAESDTLWIPCLNGLYYLNISDISFHEIEKNVLITHINKESIPWGHDGQWTLPHNKNQIRFDYETIGFNRTDKTQYSYQLLDTDESWSDWSSDTYAIYQQLPSGDFSFKIRSRSANGDEADYAQQTAYISISLDFWRHPNFYKWAFGFITILSTSLIFFLWRTFANRSKALKQERRANYLHLQALQSQMNPHFMFNALGAIQDNVLSDNVKQANKYLIQLSKLIRRFLDSTIKANLDKDGSELVGINLVEEIQLLKLFIEFEQFQYPNAFQYIIEIDETLNQETMKVPPLLIQPIVENAIIHGLLPKTDHCGQLSITMKNIDNRLRVIIEDDGIGRSESERRKKNKLNAMNSHGMELVNQRIDLLNSMGHDISFSILDREQKGTKVTIEIQQK